MVNMEIPGVAHRRLQRFEFAHGPLQCLGRIQALETFQQVAQFFTVLAELVQGFRIVPGHDRIKAQNRQPSLAQRATHGVQHRRAAASTGVLAAAKGIERSESRAYALLAVGTALAANGDTKQALSLLKDAEKAADKVAEADTREAVLQKVRREIAAIEKK